MNIKSIKIKNIGPLGTFTITPELSADGTFKPILIVGENGTGKSILLSYLADTIFEFAHNIYKDILPQNGLEYRYFRISGNSRKIGTSYGYFYADFSFDNDTKFEYLDVNGIPDVNAIQKELGTVEIPIGKKQKKETTKYNEEIIEKLRTAFKKGVYAYFPAYRFEEPFWKTENFNTKIEENISYFDQLGHSIEVVKSFEENKQYLLDLVLDWKIYNTPEDNHKILLVNNIIKILKKNNKYRLGIGPRGGFRVSIREDLLKEVSEEVLPSIDYLSLGEQLVLNIFLTIIRIADNIQQKIKELNGLVIIDEIDTHLHSDLLKEVLPQIIKLFPKIQFVISCHSPLFVLGIEENFTSEGYMLYELPSGERIDAERYREFETAYEYYKKTKKYKLDVEKLQKVTKTTIFTEGETDPVYIRKAIDLFNLTDSFTEIDICWVGHYNDVNNAEFTGASNLNHLETFFKGHPNFADIVKVIIYDCDTNKKEYNREKLYVRALKANPNNKIIKNGIENVFPEKLIKSSITKVPEVWDITKINKNRKGKKSSETKYEICNKTKLSEWICANAKQSDFSRLKPILDEIIKITKN